MYAIPLVLITCIRVRWTVGRTLSTREYFILRLRSVCFGLYERLEIRGLEIAGYPRRIPYPNSQMRTIMK